MVQNNHKPLAKFLNGKNANNKVNRWQLELPTYNITFEWISGAKNKAADCLSQLVEQLPTTQAPVNMFTVTQTDGPTFNTRSHTWQDSPSSNSDTQTNTTPPVAPDTTPMPRTLTADRLDALLQMKKTDPFCKCISKHLSNGKAPQHETDLFTHVKGLLYKHVANSRQKFLALVIPKSWKYTALVEAHDKLGHQGNTHKKTILLERYEQGYSEIYCKLHTLLQRKGQNSELPSSNDGHPWQTFQ